LLHSFIVKCSVEELLDPKNICIVFVSPRQRAHKTFHLLFEHLPKTPDHILAEEVREWDYGDYEGLLSSEIKQKDPNWSIWTQGCGRFTIPVLRLDLKSLILIVAQAAKALKICYVASM
jgi:broad specificity phosphatase PhoE